MEDDGIGSALMTWRTERLVRLRVAGELCDRAAAGTLEADHLLGAYVIALAGEFQGFCIDLLNNAVGVLLSVFPIDISPEALYILRTASAAGLLVARSNPTSANLDRDLSRFGLTLRGDLAPRTQLTPLDTMLRTRNVVAHVGGGRRHLEDGEILRLATVRQWQDDLDRLAVTLDGSVRFRLAEKLARPSLDDSPRS